MSTIVVSGSASGIGAAVAARLRSEGAQVIGVDLHDADVEVDLAQSDGRASAVEQLLRLSGGRLSGVVACAGVGPQVEPIATIISVNYFGAVALLDGLRPALVAGAGEYAAGVAVSSNSGTIVPGADGPIAQACLAGDESEARRLADAENGPVAYGASKRALASYVRRNAVGPDWAGAGVRLNAVAPGAVQTPLLQGGLDDPELGEAIRALPIPTGAAGEPPQIAAAICFLLRPESSFCCGSVLFVDGGSDALIRPDAF